MVVLEDVLERLIVRWCREDDLESPCLRGKLVARCKKMKTRCKIASRVSPSTAQGISEEATFQSFAFFKTILSFSTTLLLFFFFFFTKKRYILKIINELILQEEFKTNYNLNYIKLEKCARRSIERRSPRRKSNSILTAIYIMRLCKRIITIFFPSDVTRIN